MSKIGRKPVAVVKDVTVAVKDSSVLVSGAKGKLTFPLNPRIKVEVKDAQVFVTRLADSKQDRAMHGLTRAMIANMIVGVSEGYVKELEIQGVGFKASVQGSKLNMLMGFSHPVNIEIPEGIKIETPKPTQVFIRGIDKCMVGKIAAEIRSVFPPEPYKGKGIRYSGEYVKKKVGKAAAGSK